MLHRRVQTGLILVFLLFHLTGWTQVRQPAESGITMTSWRSDYLVPPGYHSYEEIIALADSLAEHFPSICRKVQYGSSIEGRELVALKISDHPEINETEPEVIFDGGCHGDEIGGAENLIRFARDLCLGYGADTLITGLIDSREIWLYLMVNPDGRVHMSRFNASMVDLNRDYGFMDDLSGGSTGPYSQPETKALRNCILDHCFSVYISYHSGMQQAAYPWAYRKESAPDIPNFWTLSKNYAETSLYSYLEYGQSYTIMYQTNGMSVDFAYGTTGLCCFTLELSVNKQPSDPLQYYALNYPAMLEMIRQSGWGVEGVVTDSVTGAPVEASVYVDYFYPAYNDPGNGDFHKYLLPGQHTLKVTANGYKTREGIAFTVPGQGTATVNISLSPDSGWYARRVLSCYFPEDKPVDECYTPGALGSPDNIFYSLGNGGWIILDMGDTIPDMEGDDLAVYQAGSQPEGYRCSASASMDGPWTLLGEGSGNAAFDLNVSGSARYIKITDDGDNSSSGADAGFDLDAVKDLTPHLTSVSSAPSDRPHPTGNMISIYPNPGTGQFTVHYHDPSDARFSVTDLTGRTLVTMQLTGPRATLDLSSFPDGVYFYRSEAGRTTETGMILKMH